jgi:hypothetical protein
MNSRYDSYHAVCVDFSANFEPVVRPQQIQARVWPRQTFRIRTYTKHLAVPLAYARSAFHFQPIRTTLPVTQ